MKKKILIVQFRHETNVFSPAKADEKAFENVRFHVGEQLFPNQRGMGTEVGAFLEVFEQRDDVELIPTVGLYATPSGPVTKSVYDFVMSEVAKVINENAPIDAVLIDSHGAMVAEEHPDGEGDLYEMIRNMVGEEVPIIASMDLHANVTEKMAACANALVCYECYPHTDNYETGLNAAYMMADAIDGKFEPVMAYRRIPFLLPLFPHDYPEMKPLYDKAKELEKRPNIRFVRFAHGFFPADLEEMGMSVMVVANGDRAAAEAAADELKAVIEENIPNLKRKYPSLDEALDIAEAPGDGPVVLADCSDNPGAGGVGDTTHILRRILERGITGAVIALICDPKSVEECVKAGVGSTVSLKLGGWSDPAYSGGPVEVQAYVRMITDGLFRNKGKIQHGSLCNMGKTAVIEVAGNIVLVTTLPKQALDTEMLRSHGITPEDHKIIVVKSSIHYRAAYGPISRDMIALSVPGFAPPVPELYSYKNWKG